MDSFRKWLECGAGAGGVYDKRIKIDGNWQGAVGKTGVSIKGDPIKNGRKK